MAQTEMGRCRYERCKAGTKQIKAAYFPMLREYSNKKDKGPAINQGNKVYEKQRYSFRGQKNSGNRWTNI